MWRSVRNGASVLAVAIVALGVVGLVAFDQLFETFHEIFFPPGSFLFDPRTDKLVQLFPFDFWQETALVVGGVIIVVAHRRRSRGRSSCRTDIDDRVRGWSHADRRFRSPGREPRPCGPAQRRGRPRRRARRRGTGRTRRPSRRPTRSAG